MTQVKTIVDEVFHPIIGNIILIQPMNIHLIQMGLNQQIKFKS